MKWNSASSAAILLGLVTIFLEMSSSFAQLRSRDDKCTGTGRTPGCDSQLTNLICFEGKCRCPDSVEHTSADLPGNLITRWNDQLGKCFAINGARCDIHATKKQITCLPGITCHPDPKNPESGTCGTSQILINWSLLIGALCFGIYYLH